MTLEELYQAADDDNVFFVEYQGMPAAAGDKRDLVALADSATPTVTPDELLEKLISGFAGAIVDLCVLGEVRDEDRVANCQSAWDKLKEQRVQGNYPRTVVARKQLGLPISDPKKLGTF